MNNISILRHSIKEHILKLSIEDIITTQSFDTLELNNCIREFHVLFPVAFLLHACAINRDLDESIKVLSHKLVNFLKNETKEFSYNYFTRDFLASHSEFKVPDDLDDTALVLSALLRNNTEIDQEFILKMISLESSPGGPYKTWYVDSNAEERWKDIDSYVNANVVYALSLLDIRLPNTETYLKKVLQDNTYKSPYYRFKSTFLYYIARLAYQTKDKAFTKLITTNLKKSSINTLSSQEQIFYLLAKSYCGVTLSSQELQIITLQSKEIINNTLLIPFCIDFAYKSKPTYTTNKAYSLALLFELLQVLDLNPQKKVVKNTQANRIEKNWEDSVKNTIKDELLQSKLGNIVLETYPIDNNYKSITIPINISLDISRSIGVKQQRLINNVIFAAFYGWLTYTTFDDILDTKQLNESYTTLLYLDRLQNKYLNKLSDLLPEFKLVFERTWNTIDEIYNWEFTSLRFSDAINNTTPEKMTYSYIQKRMSGFSLLISVIPMLLSIKHSKELAQKIEKIINYVVIIDQLNDDAHDYYEDLENGIITYVNADVLNNINFLKSSKSEIEIYFWQNTMKKVITDCKTLKDKAIQVCETLPTELPFLTYLIEKSFKPIGDAELELKKTEKLIDYFVTK